MFSFLDPRPGFNRREFLRGGLSLGDFALRTCTRPARRTPNLTTGKSVIFLFLHGGPTQIKPSIEDVRTGGIPSVSGGNSHRDSRHHLQRTFGGGGNCDKFTVVRSYRPGAANTISSRWFTGFLEREPWLTAALRTTTPTAASRLTWSLSTSYLSNAEKQFIPSGTSCPPVRWAALSFMPGSSGKFQTNLRLRLQPAVSMTAATCAAFDTMRQDIDRTGGAWRRVTATRGQAFDVLLRGVGMTFDLSGKREVVAIDTANLVRLATFPNAPQTSGTRTT